MERVLDECFLVDLTPDDINVEFISGYFIKGKENFIIVEEGCKSSLKKITSALTELGYDRQFLHLYVTHIHIDHGGSVGSLLRLFENSKAYLHPRGVKHLVNPEKLWKASKDSLGYIAEIYGKPDPAPENKLYPVEDGWVYEVEGNRFEFIYTEGHASHHVSIYWHNTGALFVGDSAGIYIKEHDYIIPGTIHPIRLDLYIKSLKRMIAYNPEYLMYPHYGVVSNGKRVLEEHSKQVIRYFEIAKKYRGKDLTMFLKELSETDPKLKTILDESKNIPVIKALIDLSFLGILKEAERLEDIDDDL